MKEILKWGVITVLVIYVLNFLIPVNAYASLLYVIVMIGAILTPFVILKLLGSIFFQKLLYVVKNEQGLSDDERKAEIEKLYQPSGCLIVFTYVALFFATAGFMIWHEIQMEKDELKNYGRITTANVISGQSFHSRKLDLTKVVLGFKKADGDSAFISHSISAGQFSYFYKDESVYIIYSTRYPSILEVIYTKKQMEEYLDDHPIERYIR